MTEKEYLGYFGNAILVYSLVLGKMRKERNGEDKFGSNELFCGEEMA